MTRKGEDEMIQQKILDEVAYLFVEQFDNLYGMLVDRTDVKRIRQSADDGEAGLFRVAASVFGDKLDDVLVGAANGAMDYIAYVDETWAPTDDEDRRSFSPGISESSSGDRREEWAKRCRTDTCHSYRGRRTPAAPDKAVMRCASWCFDWKSSMMEMPIKQKVRAYS